VAVPLSADFHIGLSEEHDTRVAELIPFIIDPGEFVFDPSSIPGKVFVNPVVDHDRTGDRAWRAAEIPAANGHGNARSVARVGALLACGGELEGVRLLTPPTIEKAIEEQCYGPDLVIGVPARWGLGWAINSPEIPLGPNPHTVSWGGVGGSAMVVDLDARLSWAYVMNRMFPTLTGDTRSAGLQTALYSAL